MHPLILYFRIQCENQSIHVFDTVTLIVSAGAANLATGLSLVYSNPNQSGFQQGARRVDASENDLTHPLISYCRTQFENSSLM
jgi:hypothetical protein